MTSFGTSKPCSAARCGEWIPRRMLMCRSHWRMVPSDLQDRVITTLREWQQHGSIRPYVLAVAQAQLAVAQRESQPAEVITELENDVVTFGGK